MSEGEKPVPVPRPRQLKPTDETDSAPKVYENYTIPIDKKSASVYDSLNEQLSEMKTEALRPVPVPRLRVQTTPKSEYENAPETAKPLNNQQTAADTSPSRTGAIRKAPNIPSVKNNFDETPADLNKSDDGHDFDVLSQTSSTSGKSDSKFATPSPG